MERERDIKVADYTQKINNLKSEMEFFLHSLKKREFAADANVAKVSDTIDDIHTKYICIDLFIHHHFLIVGMSSVYDRVKNLIGKLIW